MPTIAELLSQELGQKLEYIENVINLMDISEITGTSVGSLKASYHHAYNKIQAELKEIFLED